MTAKISFFPWLLILYSLTFTLLIKHTVSQDNRQAYIVYMGNRPEGQIISTAALHISMLRQVLGSNIGQESLLRSFKRSFQGFVVKLTEEEAQRMARLRGVVSVFPNRKRKLHTTRSWDFIGFSQQVERATIEGDIVIGMLDTGIWPESASFDDQGFGPPPTKWEGSCQASSNFTCNNKIIGARYYRSDGEFPAGDIISPRDENGHGSHTSSTAAGNLVSSASLYGLAQGTARGGVPSARIAVYKVCWADGCYDADMLAAFDDAIADGVDILSISIGGSNPQEYFDNAIAIGAFHAMTKGILTSVAAGNDGPSLGSITNVAPWFLSVAASTIDRKFLTTVQLGNNQTYQGISINTATLEGMLPLIYGGDAPNISAGYTNASSSFCLEDSLDQNLVKGKVVVCDILDTGEGPFYAGAAGALMRGQSNRDAAYHFPLPTSYINTADGNKVMLYLRSTSTATATLFKSHEATDTSAPYIVSFSSRGPNPVTSDILKPDLSAPGVDILAAWSLVNPVSETKGDNRFVPYNIFSGTSMACPHATAAAAYVKSFHPTWSPGAIRSTLMTTVNCTITFNLAKLSATYFLFAATPMSSKSNPEAEFAYGAGQINPIKALNPGLVYDAEAIDYIKFLCGQGYNNSILQLVTGDNSSCSETINGTVWDLNYPSFAISANTSGSGNISHVFNRVVTNVGSPSSTYKASVTAPERLKIQANPDTLNFTFLGERQAFTLTIEGAMVQSIVSASLVWDDGVHQVRSPIIVYLDYIVYMGDRPKGEFSASSVHTSILQQVIGSGAEEHLLYSYHRSFNGFVAKLTQEEVQRLKGMEGVVSVFPNGRKQLHTTRSWDFMGFSQSVQRAPTESDIIGISINTVDLKGQMLPLIYGGDAPNKTAGADGSESRYCEEGSLNETLVRGKIVLCDGLDTGEGPALAGAAGCIMSDEIYQDVAFLFPIPTSYLNLKDGSKVATYLNSTSEPTAAIFKSIAVKDEMAPSVVSFSSRGPNPITTDILKPDLTAPGVDILASWSLATKLSESPEDNRVSPYNIISGTSMSCPHASSIAAYVKSFHPTWSPAAIKSALMTTASPMNVEYNSDAEFGYGSGHLNPVKAADPGLIYDAGVLDYVKFLCGQGYNTTLLRILTGDNNSCSAANTGAVWDLNYPSFAVSTNSTQSITRVFHRNVTNVGSPVSTYKAAVVTQPGLGIQVQPSVLSFKYVGETKSFVVTVTAEVSKSLNRSSGSLVWDDGVHQVRSPVVAYYLFESEV
ncbi:cucumisin-like [Pistacia vera]|uniref:cucumisin-like n=1 Tax=Pistacia vera TaxID=55513 RepID=UPI00126392B9|nr:cucumisin-like [Pistacia vera]